MTTTPASQNFFGRLIGDGRPLLLAMAGSLTFAGGFAIFLAVTGDFLPHDISYLGMTADELCAVADCRIVDFMIHDRGAFGGVLVGLGVLYAWLVAFPLSDGQPWAWWTMAVSGGVGFLGFVSYLGAGYIDTWHGVGTMLLIPVFVVGLWRTRRILDGPVWPTKLFRWPPWFGGRDRFVVGRILLVAGAFGTAAGGAAILRVGLGDTFVPEDLEFIGLATDDIRAVDENLLPLLVHDRIGFGAGLVTLGLTTGMCLWFADWSRHVHQAVLVAGVLSLAAAVGVHFMVGYTDAWHLTPPAVAGACLVAGGILHHPGTRTSSGHIDSIVAE